MAVKGWPLQELQGISINEAATANSMRQLYQNGYVSEPHAAVAAAALTNSLLPDETGVFLGTAHPAKFKDAVDKTLGIAVKLPPALQAVADKTVLSAKLPPEFDRLKSHLLSIFN